MAVFKQDGRRTKIVTILGISSDENTSDPLLLSKVEGKEAISQPFEYTLTLLRPKEMGPLEPDTQLPQTDPFDLFGTPAKISVQLKRTHYVEQFSEGTTSYTGVTEASYIDRFGVFFNYDEIASLDDFFVYTATLVPAFALLKREIVFRVFEDKDVIAILRSVFQGFPNLFVDYSFLETEKGQHPNDFPKLEYCVQFGESSFDFASRLMARFGIWYYFRHDGKPSARNETMVLQRSSHKFLDCEVQTGPLAGQFISEMVKTDGDPSVFAVSGFQRHFDSTFKLARAGNFNQLKPVSPFTGEERIDPNFDTLVANAEDAKRFDEISFPAPVRSHTESRSYAKLMLQAGESRVFTYTGQCRNPTFFAGAHFFLDQEVETNTEAGGSSDITPEHDYQQRVTVKGKHAMPLLLTAVSFTAYDNSYSASTLNDILLIGGSTVAGLLPFDLPGNIQGGGLTFAQSTAAQGLNNYLLNEEQDRLNATTPVANRPFWGFVGAGVVANVTALLPTILPNVINAVKEVVRRHASEYSNKFEAVELPTPRPPLPKGFTVPVASGPHLATVIGLNGIGQSGTDLDIGNVYADALGRVRVRFPWDRKADETQPAQFHRGDDTCWVRVSQPWASQRYGVQFLPRIGDEVLVDFLGGDPEQPIITGRVYNADHGAPNQPFPADRQTGFKQINTVADLNGTGRNTYYRSGIRTQSLPVPEIGSNSRFHLLRFDDTYNCEQILLRSQGRLDVTSFAHSFETTHGNKNVKVVQGLDKNNAPFGGAMLTTVGGEYDMHVGGSHYEAVDKDYQLTVKGDTSLDLKGKLTAVVKGAASVGADSLVIEATEQITFKVGASWIVITPCGVYVNGPQVCKNSGGSPGSSSSVTMLTVGDAETAEPGDEYYERLTPCDPQPQGHGGRGSTSDHIDPAKTCEQLSGKLNCSWLPDPPPAPSPGGQSREPNQSTDPNQGGVC